MLEWKWDSSLSPVKLQTVAGKQISKSSLTRAISPLNIIYLPSLLLETSIWEHASVRASAVEAGGFGASAATLELAVTVCVGEEVAGSRDPSEMLLLPSWPVGGASPTTDEQQQHCKYVDNALVTWRHWRGEVMIGHVCVLFFLEYVQ